MADIGGTDDRPGVPDLPGAHGPSAEVTANLDAALAKYNGLVGDWRKAADKNDQTRAAFLQGVALLEKLVPLIRAGVG